MKKLFLLLSLSVSLLNNAQITLGFDMLPTNDTYGYSIRHDTDTHAIFERDWTIWPHQRIDTDVDTMNFPSFSITPGIVSGWNDKVGQNQFSDSCAALRSLALSNPGPQGIQGIQGPQGNPGSTGATGGTGATGNTGATGAQGSAGTDATSPAGGIQLYAGSSAPTGYLLCDGSAISRTTYSALFAIISTTYGTGDGSTTFNLPDLRQRFPLGKAASGTGSTLGATGGTIDHTHTVTITSENATVLLNLGQVASDGMYTTSAANPPFLTVNYIIKY